MRADPPRSSRASRRALPSVPDMSPAVSRLALVAAALSITLGLVAAYGRTAILDGNDFAARATTAVASDEVTEELTTRFTKGITEERPDLITLRPALETAAVEVAATPWFKQAFAAAALRMHRDVFDGAGARPALHVPGMEAQVHAAIARRTPEIAVQLPARADPSLMSIGGNARERALLAAGRGARGPSLVAAGALVLGLLGLVLSALRAA